MTECQKRVGGEQKPLLEMVDEILREHLGVKNTVPNTEKDQNAGLYAYRFAAVTFVPQEFRDKNFDYFVLNAAKSRFFAHAVSKIAENEAEPTRQELEAVNNAINAILEIANTDKNRSRTS